MFGFRATDSEKRKVKNHLAKQSADWKRNMGSDVSLTGRQLIDRNKGFRRTPAQPVPQATRGTVVNTPHTPPPTSARPAPVRPVTAQNPGTVNTGGKKFREAAANTPERATVQVRPRLDARGRDLTSGATIEVEGPGSTRKGGGGFSQKPDPQLTNQAREVAAATRARVDSLRNPTLPLNGPDSVEVNIPREPSTRPQMPTADRASADALRQRAERIQSQIDTLGADPKVADGQQTPRQRLQAELDGVNAQREELKTRVKPSESERIAAKDADIAQRQQATSQARVDAARAQADRAGRNPTLREAAGEAADKLKTGAQKLGERVAAEVPKAKEGLRSAGNVVEGYARSAASKAGELGGRARNAADDLVDNVKQRLNKSEVPEAPKPKEGFAAVKEKAKDFGNKGLRFAGKAATGTGNVLASPYRASKAIVKTPLSPKVAGPVAGLQAIADADQFVRGGGNLKDYPGHIVGGLKAAVDRDNLRRKALSEAVERGDLTGLQGGLGELTTLLSSAGEIGLDAAEGIVDLGSGVAGGFRGLFNGEGFFDSARKSYDAATAERGLFGQASDYLDTEADKMIKNAAGDLYTRQTEDAPTPEEQAVAAAAQQTAVGATPSEQAQAQAQKQVAVATDNGNGQPVGNTDTTRMTNPNDNYTTYTDNDNNVVMEGVRRNHGGGTFSTYDGNAVNESLRRANAIRQQSVDAQRAREGYGPGQRSGGLRSGGGGVGREFSRQELRNMMVKKPDYDNKLTPRQNAARLANWQAEVGLTMASRGINPQTGERADSGGTSLSDQIAMANLERNSSKDQFDKQMKLLDFSQKSQKQVNDFVTQANEDLNSGESDRVIGVLRQAALAEQQFGPDHPLAQLGNAYANTQQSQRDASGLFGRIALGREGSNAANYAGRIDGLTPGSTYWPDEWLDNKKRITNPSGGYALYDMDNPEERALYEYLSRPGLRR